MGLFTNFFLNKKHSESAVLIDISSDSVAGAYVHYDSASIPNILYTRRLPVEVRKDESVEKAMLRAFQILGTKLIHEGSPILLRITGDGHADSIIVSTDTPWQENKMRIENFERKKPFVFTKEMVTTALKETSVVPPKKMLADECVVGTVLNGYETANPYGKIVHRASVIVLTSFIDKHVAENIESLIRSLYHTKKIQFVSGNSIRFQAMCKAFPHESDALIIDAIGPSTSIALINKNLFSALVEISNPVKTAIEWTKAVMDKFSELASQYPLPRTIFLIAEKSDITDIKHALCTTNSDHLWLSDKPPKIVPLIASHLTNLVRQTTTASPDLRLLLMALYYNKMI